MRFLIYITMVLSVIFLIMKWKYRIVNMLLKWKQFRNFIVPLSVNFMMSKKKNQNVS